MTLVSRDPDSQTQTQFSKIQTYVFIIFILQTLTLAKVAHAFHEDFENHEYTRPALIATGTISVTYLLSQLHDGPALFAGVYSLGSLFLMNEWYVNEKDPTELIVPMSLITLAVINVSLLRDHETYSKSEVFTYNLTGIGLISAYAIWEHAHKSAPNSSFAQILPFQKDKYSGLLFTNASSEQIRRPSR